MSLGLHPLEKKKTMETWKSENKPFPDLEKSWNLKRKNKNKTNKSHKKKSWSLKKIYLEKSWNFDSFF